MESATELATIAAMTIALVDAVKILLPEAVHGLVTIILAVVIGLILTWVALPAGVVAALAAVGVITTAKRIGQ